MDMNEFIAVSFMTRRASRDIGYFHFKGVFKGLAIQKIEVRGSQAFNIKTKEEYILHLKVISFNKEKSTLIAKLLKARAIDDLRGEI